MEQTETVANPASEAEASLTASPEESASPPTQNDDISPAAREQMNALIRGHVGQEQAGSASKSDDDSADDDLADDQDGASASAQEGVKPSGQPSPQPGRRGAAAEIQRLSGEVERLTKALDDLTPKVPDASEEARQAAIDIEARYRRLLVKPDNDPDWTADDIDFLSNEKAKRATQPELQRHYETVLAEDIKNYRALLDAQHQQAWTDLRRDLSSTLSLPGVTDAVKADLIKAPLSEQILIHRRLEREAAEADMRRLRDENADLKREVYRATRVSVPAGRSANGRFASENDTMNSIIRGGRF